jgi:ribose transport system substrate-binding protein
MSFRKPLIASLLVAGLFASAGCGGTPSNSPTGDAPEPPAGKEYNVTLIRWDANDDFFNGIQAAEEAEYQRLEKELGVKFNVTVAAAVNDEAKQVDALQAAIAKGTDGVSLVSWRGAAMTNLVKQLGDEGIPIVTHNSFVPGVEQTFVSFDGVTAGEKAAQAVVDTLDKNRGEDWRKGDGVIVELRCLITLSTDVDRHNGMHKVIDPIMSTNDKIAYVEQEAECDGEKARKIVDDAITKYGAEKLLMVLAIDGTAAIGGAIPALKAAEILYPNTDPKYVPVASVDCSKAELDSISAGEETECSEQPAGAEGTVTSYLLADMMINGVTKPTKDPSAVQEAMMAAYGEQPWMPISQMPATVQPEFKGVWYGINSFAVPGEVAVDAPGHWAK